MKIPARPNLRSVPERKVGQDLGQLGSFGHFGMANQHGNNRNLTMKCRSQFNRYEIRRVAKL
jgi:hypothetical protein